MNLHEDIYGDVSQVPERRGTWPAKYGVNLMNLGTPGEFARRRAAKLYRIYNRVASVCFALILVAGGVFYYAHKDEPIPILFKDRAMALPIGGSLCRPDVHEQCLVCLHREAQGVLRSVQCPLFVSPITRS